MNGLDCETMKEFNPNNRPDDVQPGNPIILGTKEKGYSYNRVSLLYITDCNCKLLNECSVVAHSSKRQNSPTVQSDSTSRSTRRRSNLAQKKNVRASTKISDTLRSVWNGEPSNVPNAGDSRLTSTERIAVVLFVGLFWDRKTMASSSIYYDTNLAVRASTADCAVRRISLAGEDDLIVPPPSSWFESEIKNKTTDPNDEVLPLASYPSSSDYDDENNNEYEGEQKEQEAESEIYTRGTDLAALNGRKNHQQRQQQFDEDGLIPAETGLGVAIHKKGPSRSNSAESDSESLDASLPSYSPPPFLTATASLESLPPPLLPPNFTPVVGAPLPSPGNYYELSKTVLPAAAKELLHASVQRLWYAARRSYAVSRQRSNYSDYGNPAAGYDMPNDNISNNTNNGPSFSSLSWVERQLVQEWRTYSNDTANKNPIEDDTNDDEDAALFDRARTVVPAPLPRPIWNRRDFCEHCNRTFGPALLRHHCRNCGKSFCQTHSSHTHSLPMFGYAVAERVCTGCKVALQDQNLAERVAWRLARCRDSLSGTAQPYFEIGLDSIEQAALRITKAALTMAKSIPLGAQASVAVETVDVLRKYGLHGIYTILLRQEFLAAADLLLKALGINRTAWPLSVHELSAAIFYALAQHRAMRGMHPDREHWIHAVRTKEDDDNIKENAHEKALGDSDVYDSAAEIMCHPQEPLPLFPVCDALPDSELHPLIFYAPIALNFIYVDKEVDMQLLAAQQGWRLVYAYLRCSNDDSHKMVHDRPASALFVQERSKVACLAVRGTSTIQDVITDIRQVPVPFPDPEKSRSMQEEQDSSEEWTKVFGGQGLAVAGMADAAVNLYREHIDSLMMFAKQGYRIRMTGHSLGGAVATLLGAMVYKDLSEHLPSMQGKTGEADSPLHVYAYGTPSCVDLPLAEAMDSFVTSAVLHDDVVPRLTPTSCRCLLKHLLHIRETWVKDHFADDIRAFTDRAKTAWAPRLRGGFTLSVSSSMTLKRYCSQKIQYGKKQLLYVKEMLVSDESAGVRSALVFEQEDDFDGKISWLAVSTDSKDGNTVEPDYHDVVLSQNEQDTPRLVMDIMGGMDAKTEAMVIDGDEFFDTEANLIEDGSDDESDTTNEIFDESLAQSAVSGSDFGEQVHKDGNKAGPLNIAESNVPSSLQFDIDDDASPGAVVLEEAPLPRMFIPGKVVHIYAHRGVYRACYVPRAFRELRRISMAGNMLADHKTKNYYDALLEVSSVRKALESPPSWSAFDEDDTWYVGIIDAESN
jgi:Lipase (class 3)/FYVE zinc finger